MRPFHVGRARIADRNLITDNGAQRQATAPPWTLTLGRHLCRFEVGTRQKCKPGRPGTRHDRGESADWSGDRDIVRGLTRIPPSEDFAAKHKRRPSSPWKSGASRDSEVLFAVLSPCRDY